MRYAGVHWPNGPEPERVWYLPGTTTVMLDSEARWHYDRYRNVHPDRMVLWRSIAIPPETIGWDPSRYVDEVLKCWPEQPHWGVEHLVPANELNLNYERGQLGDDDWDPDTMARVYAQSADFLEAVWWELYARGYGHDAGSSVALHYPAWAPGHYLREHADTWVKRAKRWDVIDFHAYGTWEEIYDEYQWYRATFPNHPLYLSEWNTRDTNEDLSRVLQGLADLAVADPDFLGASYFIWRWHIGAGAHPGFDVEGNAEREALFFDPPHPSPEEQACSA